MTAADKQTIWQFLKLASSLQAGFPSAAFADTPAFEDDPAEPQSTSTLDAASTSPAAPASETDTSAPVVPPPASEVPQVRHEDTLGAPPLQEPASVEAQVETREAQVAASLDELSSQVAACRSCVLCQKRTRPVPGEGVLTPAVLVVGEGPGADEDRTGRPFVGRAGQLLDKMLASICLSRTANCYIANAVKCRPPMNRTPMSDEVASCRPFLREQIRILRPQFILAMGRSAVSSLLGTTAPLNTLRGKWFDYDSGGTAIPLLVTYHPSALLRDESLKRPAWEDLKLLRARLQKQLPLYAKPFHAQI